MTVSRAIDIDRPDSLIGATVLVGISYYDPDGKLLQQRMLAGTVVAASKKDGITLRRPEPERDFTLPGELSCWFAALPGSYTDSDGHRANDPDFLVTWDVYRKKSSADEGQHEWWEWVPNTVPPRVG